MTEVAVVCHHKIEINEGEKMNQDNMIIFKSKLNNQYGEIETHVTLLALKGETIGDFAESQWQVFREENGKKEELSKEELAKDFLVTFNKNDKLFAELLNYNYTDITEKELLGLPALDQEFLYKNGVVAQTGKRKILFHTGTRNADIKIKEVRWDDKKNLCSTIHDFFDKEKNSTTFLLNTDEIFALNASKEDDNYWDKDSLSLRGNVAATVEGDVSLLIHFPIRFTIHNPNKRIRKKGFASIDFGTKATCIALHSVQDNKPKTELLGLRPLTSDDENPKEKTENATTIAVLQWKNLSESLYKEAGKHETKGKFPHFKIDTSKRTNTFSGDIKWGNDVNDSYILNDTLTLNSGQLKSLFLNLKYEPYLRHLGKTQGKKTFASMDNPAEDELIVTYQTDVEDTDSFNPIAFYGYLLARFVNAPKFEQLTTEFYITKPVAFPQLVLDEIEESLKHGIMRALPSSVENKCKVHFKDYEPVAFVGSIFGKSEDSGKEALIVDRNDTTAKVFAVYDLGGGTLDYSFGVCSWNHKKERTEITVLGIGGNPNLGGEKLVHFVTDEIYRSNVVEKYSNLKEIPYQYQDFFKDSLKGKDVIDYGEEKSGLQDRSENNQMRIREKFARKIFYAGDVDEANIIDQNISLIPLEGDINAEESVDLVLASDSVEIVKDIIDDSVQDFKQWLRRCIKNNMEYLKEKSIEENTVDELVKNLFIYKAGNTSRSKFVEEAIERHFKKTNPKRIQLIDEEKDRSMQSHVSVTPKTGVAWGQAILMAGKGIKIQMHKNLKYRILKPNRTGEQVSGKDILFENNKDYDTTWHIFARDKEPDDFTQVDYTYRNLLIEKNEIDYEEDDDQSIRLLKSFLKHATQKYALSEKEMETLEDYAKDKDWQDIDIYLRPKAKSLTELEVLIQETQEDAPETLAGEEHEPLFTINLEAS